MEQTTSQSAELAALKQLNESAQAGLAARSEQKIQDRIGPRIEPTQARAWLQQAAEHAADLRADEARIEAAAELLGRNAWMQHDPAYRDRVDVVPRVVPQPVIPAEVQSPVQFRQWKRSVGDIAADPNATPAVREAALKIVSGRDPRVAAEAKERGLDVDAGLWEYELRNPSDSWPEGLNAASFDADLLSGKADPNAVPHWDVAQRGPLTFEDWLRFVGDHDHLAERVQPRLGSVLRAAVASGLVKRTGDQYVSVVTGKQIDIPQALRDERTARIVG